MKKIFTLISVALVAMSVNAQEWTADVEYVAAPGGTMATEFQNPTAEGNNKVVTITKDVVTLNVVSSREPEEITLPGKTDLTWPEDGGWKTAGFRLGGNNKESSNAISFYTVIGTGVPAISFEGKQKYTDGMATGQYHPNFNDGVDGAPNGWNYYNPDGSVGLPNYGMYIKAKSTAAGVLKVGAFVQNNATRLLYIVKGSDKKTLQWTEDKNTTGYIVEGYVQGATVESQGALKFFNSIPVIDYVIGGAGVKYGLGWEEEGAEKMVDISNSRKWIWFVIDVDPSEEYYFFGNNWQLGFQGFNFYKGKSIKDYTPAGIETIETKAENPNAPIYNLAGQQVTKSYKGVVIQNGKKFFQK